MADKSRNIVAALSYFLGFITGITILLVEKEDKFVRFHAMQSVVTFGGIFLINLFINYFLGFASSFLSSIISIVSLIVWLVSMVKAGVLKKTGEKRWSRYSI